MWIERDRRGRLTVTALDADDAHATRLAQTLGFHLGDDRSAIDDALIAIETVASGRADTADAGLNDLQIRVGRQDVRLIDDIDDIELSGDHDGLGYPHETLRSALTDWRRVVDAQVS